MNILKLHDVTGKKTQNKHDISVLFCDVLFCSVLLVFREGLSRVSHIVCVRLTTVWQGAHHVKTGLKHREGCRRVVLRRHCTSAAVYRHGNRVGCVNKTSFCNVVGCTRISFGHFILN